MDRGEFMCLAGDPPYSYGENVIPDPGTSLDAYAAKCRMKAREGLARYLREDLMDNVIVHMKLGKGGVLYGGWTAKKG